MARTETRSIEAENPGPTRPAKFAHVVLRTRDLQRARDWYVQFLNGSVGYENDMVCFVTYDEEHHRVGLIAAPEAMPPSPGSCGLDHFAFTYASLGALLANHRRLKAAGIVPYWCINHGPTISLYYRDPDGNKIETQYDVFESARQATDFIDRYYGENFMGIIFDPEALAARYEAGEPLQDLLRRPSLPPGKTPWDMHIP